MPYSNSEFIIALSELAWFAHLMHCPHYFMSSRRRLEGGSSGSWSGDSLVESAAVVRPRSRSPCSDWLGSADWPNCAHCAHTAAVESYLCGRAADRYCFFTRRRRAASKHSRAITAGQFHSFASTFTRSRPCSEKHCSFVTDCSQRHPHFVVTNGFPAAEAIEALLIVATAEMVHLLSPLQSQPSHLIW